MTGANRSRLSAIEQLMFLRANVSDAAVNTAISLAPAARGRFEATQIGNQNRIANPGPANAIGPALRRCRPSAAPIWARRSCPPRSRSARHRCRRSISSTLVCDRNDRRLRSASRRAGQPRQSSPVWEAASHHIRKMPKRVGGAGPRATIARQRPITSRVSTGAMTPSSHSLAPA